MKGGDDAEQRSGGPGRARLGGADSPGVRARTGLPVDGDRATPGAERGETVAGAPHGRRLSVVLRAPGEHGHHHPQRSASPGRLGRSVRSWLVVVSLITCSHALSQDRSGTRSLHRVLRPQSTGSLPAPHLPHSATRTATAGRIEAARRAGQRVARSDATSVAPRVRPSDVQAIGNDASSVPKAGLLL